MFHSVRGSFPSRHAVEKVISLLSGPLPPHQVEELETLLCDETENVLAQDIDTTQPTPLVNGMSQAWASALVPFGTRPLSQAERTTISERVLRVALRYIRENPGQDTDMANLEYYNDLLHGQDGAIEEALQPEPQHQHQPEPEPEPEPKHQSEPEVEPTPPMMMERPTDLPEGACAIPVHLVTAFEGEVPGGLWMLVIGNIRRFHGVLERVLDTSKGRVGGEREAQSLREEAFGSSFRGVIGGLAGEFLEQAAVVSATFSSFFHVPTQPPLVNRKHAFKQRHAPLLQFTSNIKKKKKARKLPLQSRPELPRNRKYNTRVTA
ncbi:hypothetical protein CC80DRAFT_571887 [Byssothecium circinans]|uniref:Uncharacterized protein n=1 Tax=Byssothecium circinans TaxID=147558 RepID=A0A6A5TUR5_9PLEO|nr:hypothetical protein CC80DRAFT_571887 [Byssothecium circinans]